jgi:hypothetical protein
MAGGGSDSMKAGWIMPMRMDEVVDGARDGLDGGCIGDLELGHCLQPPLALGLGAWGWSWGACTLQLPNLLRLQLHLQLGRQRVSQWLMQGRTD